MENQAIPDEAIEWKEGNKQLITEKIFIRK